MRALKERINWRWPRGWKAWGIILILFVVGFDITTTPEATHKYSHRKSVTPTGLVASRPTPIQGSQFTGRCYAGRRHQRQLSLTAAGLFFGDDEYRGGGFVLPWCSHTKAARPFRKWAWLAGGIIFALKHIYAWWLVLGDATVLGIAGAYFFGPRQLASNHAHALYPRRL